MNHTFIGIEYHVFLGNRIVQTASQDNMLNYNTSYIRETFQLQNLFASDIVKSASVKNGWIFAHIVK